MNLCVLRNDGEQESGVRGQESGIRGQDLVTLSAAKGLDSMLKRFFAALRMTEGADS
jgi:hypothetical protein